MATAQRVSDAMAHLSAIKPLGDKTNAAAAPVFNFGASKSGATASVAPSHDHFQAKKRSSELGDRLDDRNGGDSRFEDEDWDPTGPMEKASAAELANRKIVRRARRKKSAAPGVSQVKGLFGGTSGITGTAPAAPSAPSFKFGASAQKKESVASAPAATPSFAFKFNTGSGETTTTSNDQAQSTSEKPAFKFGAAAGPPAFAFKIDAPVKSTEPPAPSGFSFNIGPPATSVDNEEDNTDDEPEQETGTIVAGAGEEAETTEREHKAKLYRLRDGEWREQGMGQLKLNRDKKSGKRRLLMRAGLRVVLNTPLFKGQLVKLQGAGILFTAAEVVDGKQTTASFLLKVNKEQLSSLADAMAAGHGAPSATTETPLNHSAKEDEKQSPADQTFAAMPEQNKQVEDQAKPSPVEDQAPPAAVAAPKPFVFKAPDAAAVMPATSNQPVFTFGGPSKLIQPSDNEMDEVEGSDGEGTSDESFAEEDVDAEEEDDDEGDGEEQDNNQEEEEEEEEEHDTNDDDIMGDDAAIGVGAGLAAHAAEKEAAASNSGSLKTASPPDRSAYRAQLEDYQNALEDWVQIAQREEKHRRALENQLANAAAGGLPVTPRKQHASDTAAAEVAELQAQLARVKADAEQKLGDLRSELETQQATATRTLAEAEELRKQNQVAQAEITKLKTPTKAVVPAPKPAIEETTKIAELSQEVEILKKLFLASASASPAASEIQAQQQRQQVMPIPSPSKVLATPTAVRGSPHAIGSASKAANHSQHMHALNKQIASWVNSSLASNPDADLTPQLKDYMNHVSGWQDVHNKWFRPSSN